MTTTVSGSSPGSHRNSTTVGGRTDLHGRVSRIGSYAARSVAWIATAFLSALLGQFAFEVWDWFLRLGFLW